MESTTYRDLCFLVEKGWPPAMILKMSFAQRQATIATHLSLNDPEFKTFEFIQRSQYFVGYEEEKQAYFKRNREKDQRKLAAEKANNPQQTEEQVKQKTEAEKTLNALRAKNASYFKK